MFNAFTPAQRPPISGSMSKRAHTIDQHQLVSLLLEGFVAGCRYRSRCLGPWRCADKVQQYHEGGAHSGGGFDDLL